MSQKIEWLASDELQSIEIPPLLLHYAVVTERQWREAGDSCAMIATDRGIVITTEGLAQQKPLELNNMCALMSNLGLHNVTYCFAPLVDIRATITDAERRQQTPTPETGKTGLSRAQQSLQDIVAEAASQHASDIHIRFTRLRALVRFRVNGQLSAAIKRSRAALVEALAAALNSYSDDYRQVFNEHDSVSASLTISLDHQTDIRLRLQQAPTYDGFTVTLRLQYQQTTLQRQLHQLGLVADVLQALQWVRRCQQGLVLFIGPTGHGKTTTLAAFNQCLAEQGKVISLEDPVEIVLPAIEQRQLSNSQSDEGLADAIAETLREDPDVLSISEIRGHRTAKAALQAALSGHLVTATLHAADTIGAVQRLLQLGLTSAELAGSGVLTGLFAQRLNFVCGNPHPIVEYTILDNVGRQCILQQQWQQWRQYLQQQGWCSLADRLEQEAGQVQVAEAVIERFQYRS
ncbi:hypothetical protein CWI84_04800 [Idiomarina tyrosinivorans]|uniref:Bacterial type II secretion system protein E domain-containing protein n=1 Tax=Idiomarina tyrosinivorans TaxID=1445662 RepID=A0A432ZR55_9GAMM|nr:ATPase, T2SS/T4P/T4SS family [Idiomarina tyrosinivorans]RUO80390.1 hypothetical protein CWI84_04800 [Idiomarina tyrosinivorans]